MLEASEPLYILSMIVRQYRLLLLARELLDARASESGVAQALAMKPYAASKICAQARRYGLAELEQIYRRLLEYDVEIKTGRIEAAAALDALVGALTAA
jgi:DNA polymerase-3 subunit delta